MKIKRTVLRSIIEAVIREQPEGLNFALDDDDLKLVYKAIAETTMSVTWGREISFLVVKIVSAIFSRSVNTGMVSLTELSESANKILANPRVLGAANQISAKALQASPSYIACSPKQQQTAYDALQRVVRVAFESLIGAEIAYALMYDLSEVSTEFSAMKQDVDSTQGYGDPRYSNANPLSKIPVNDIEEVQDAISNLDTLRAAQSAWEMIMKFVGGTHQHENSHLSEVADASLFGLEDHGWGPDIFGFGFDVPPPF